MGHVVLCSLPWNLLGEDCSLALQGMVMHSPSQMHSEMHHDTVNNQRAHSSWWTLTDRGAHSFIDLTVRLDSTSPGDWPKREISITSILAPSFSWNPFISFFYPFNGFKPLSLFIFIFFAFSFKIFFFFLHSLFLQSPGPCTIGGHEETGVTSRNLNQTHYRVQVLYPGDSPTAREWDQSARTEARLGAWGRSMKPYPWCLATGNSKEMFHSPAMRLFLFTMSSLSLATYDWLQG